MSTDKMNIKIRIDGVEKAKGGLGGVTSSIGDMVKGIAIATAAIYGLKKVFDASMTFKNASRDAEEMSSKFKTVFESISIKAEETAESLSNSFGIAESTAMELLGATGDILVGFGFSENAALDLSEKVNRLAVDLASFTNYEGGAEGASAALTKAMLGETESAKALGIVLRQGTKEFKASVKQLQESEGMTYNQAMATTLLNDAYKQSGKAIGDFARTQHQLANQERILTEETKKFKEMVGDKLQPIFVSATEASISFMRSLTETPLDSTIRSLEELGAAAADILVIKKFNWSVQLEDINAKLKKAGIHYEDIKDVAKETATLQTNQITLLKRRGQVLSDEEMTYTQIKNTYLEIGYMEDDAIVKANTWLSMTNERGKAEQMVERHINDQLKNIKELKGDLVKYSNDLIDRETLEAKIAQTIGKQTEEIVTQTEATEVIITGFAAYLAMNQEMVMVKQRESEWNDIIIAQYPALAAAMGLVKEEAGKIVVTAEKFAVDWQQAAGLMSNMLYEAFDGSFENVEEQFKNMIKRMMADLVVSGLLKFLLGITGGFGMFGSGGLLSGLFGGGVEEVLGGGGSPTINVSPPEVNITLGAIGISRAAEQGNIMRNVL